MKTLLLLAGLALAGCATNYKYRTPEQKAEDAKKKEEMKEEIRQQQEKDAQQSPF